MWSHYGDVLKSIADMEKVAFLPIICHVGVVVVVLKFSCATTLQTLKQRLRLRLRLARHTSTPPPRSVHSYTDHIQCIRQHRESERSTMYPSPDDSLSPRMLSQPPSPSLSTEDEDAPLLMSDVPTTALAMLAWKSSVWIGSRALLLFHPFRSRSSMESDKTTGYTDAASGDTGSGLTFRSRVLVACCTVLVIGTALTFLPSPVPAPPSSFLPTPAPLSPAALSQASPSTETPTPAPPSLCDLACPWFRSFDSPILSRTQSSTGADWSSYITPTTFRDMTDWAYWRHPEVIGPSDPLVGVNTTTALECLPPGALIYVQTTMLGKFWEEVHPIIRHPYFLITGSADVQVPGGWAHYLDPTADGRPSQLMHWFGQNGNSTHPHFTSIPIGIPFPMTDALDLTLHGQQSVVEGDWYVQDKTVGGVEVAVADRPYHRHIQAFQWDHSGDWDDERWVLANFDLHTNEAERIPLWRLMCGNETGEATPLPFVHCALKQSGTRQYYGGMRTTYHRHGRYRFHLSPPGNGMDCHRTWEAIYLGVVPILLTSPLDRLFASLPVMIVQRWEDVTMEALRGKWEELLSVYGGKALDRMHFSYWKQLVIDVAKRELAERGLSIMPSWTDLKVERRRCWGHADR